MVVQIERISSLFPKEVVKKLMKIPTGKGQCAYNSAKACMVNGYDIRYCEGWLHNGIVGHAFNKLVMADGTEHYFDISQEYLNKLDPNDVPGDVELETEIDKKKVWDTFGADKEAHLIAVPIWKGYKTYDWYKKQGLVELYWG